LSATQKPIETIGHFLSGNQPCSIVDTGHQRQRDLQLALPASPLSAVMENEVWSEIHEQLADLVEDHRTTLIFVNTRRLSERLARHLAERIGEEAVTAHHGSLSRKHRFEAESALKSGRLRALVATASLELGIDIGHIDLVCQLGSPGSIAAFLQRVGRAGHAVDEIPKGRLFPLSRDDLVESVALLRAVELGELDAICIPTAPLDVLCQQLVAEVSARDWSSDALYQQFRQAWPYRELDREDFNAIINMLAEGYATRRGRRSAYLYHDAVNGILRARPAARLVALQNGGAIPDHFDYEVVMLPQGHRIGTLNEDFAFESIPGDIFQLGNTSYRMLKIEQPFWVGDAPGRSDELSFAVSRLRSEMQEKLEQGGAEAGLKMLLDYGIDPSAAEQLCAYLDATLSALGCLPTHKQIVLERFFDDSGDMHLVIHAPMGSRLMRAWGLALRKRFCRRFNFELQAAALEDSLILSLGETHSFRTEDVPAYLNAASVREVLIQALLDAPMFEVRWRWCASIALAIQRMRNGQRLPPQWQRNQAEDLVAVVFPDQLACLENIRGAREIPDHPLVQQTITDCLTETMDIDGLENLLRDIDAGKITIHCHDLTTPSPLSREIINARPYAFLDDGEAENRRTRAIRAEPDDLGQAASSRIISRTAIEQVRTEAWISPRDAEELHDGLLTLGFLTAAEFTSGSASSGAAGTAIGWAGWFNDLTTQMRACACKDGAGHTWWVATERLAEWRAIHPEVDMSPDTSGILPDKSPPPDEALVSLLRSRLSGLGPVTPVTLEQDFNLPGSDLQVALARLIEMQGSEGHGQWCERRLLARIHRYSREQRRRTVKPVSPQDYMRFLANWQGFSEPSDDLDDALACLQGWAAPVSAWEQSLLPARCRAYTPEKLDQRFLSGQCAWFRPATADSAGNNRQIVAATPVAIVERAHLDAWHTWPQPTDSSGITDALPDDAFAQKIFARMERHGPMFTTDLAGATGLLDPQLEQGLKALVSAGCITADAFSPLRWLLRSEVSKRRAIKRGRRGAPGNQTLTPLGRWSLVRLPGRASEADQAQLQEHLAWQCVALLRRYGVVFRAVLQREPLLPPWRLLLAYLRRMEDRGEVRGGRFVDGFSGEQFALPEAVGMLRQTRSEPGGDRIIVISAVDPLNQCGFILPGPRTPAVLGNRIALQNGLPVARLVGGDIDWLTKLPPESSAAIENQLQVVHHWRAGISK
jgi:ATP-dependent Lhr-like helicase